MLWCEHRRKFELNLAISRLPRHAAAATRLVEDDEDHRWESSFRSTTATPHSMSMSLIIFKAAFFINRHIDLPGCWAFEALFG
jgi:hypothetical protein